MFQQRNNNTIMTRFVRIAHKCLDEFKKLIEADVYLKVVYYLNLSRSCSRLLI